MNSAAVITSTPTEYRALPGWLLSRHVIAARPAAPSVGLDAEPERETFNVSSLDSQTFLCGADTLREAVAFALGVEA